MRPENSESIFFFVLPNVLAQFAPAAAAPVVVVVVVVAVVAGRLTRGPSRSAFLVFCDCMDWGDVYGFGV